jgi:hypothetical protein
MLTIIRCYLLWRYHWDPLKTQNFWFNVFYGAFSSNDALLLGRTKSNFWIKIKRWCTYFGAWASHLEANEWWNDAIFQDLWLFSHAMEGFTKKKNERKRSFSKMMRDLDTLLRSLMISEKNAPCWQVFDWWVQDLKRNAWSPHDGRSNTLTFGYLP